nr:MFS transporter [Bradyrhizobium uaiense]
MTGRNARPAIELQTDRGWLGSLLGEKPEPVLFPADERLTGRAVWGATIGNILEFYDFGTFSFFAIQIGHAFLPAGDPPIGAILLGSYSDRAGRRSAMSASFTLMRVAVLVCTYTLVRDNRNCRSAAGHFARLVQGFALDGEVGPTTAYLIEAAPAEARGHAQALVALG